MTLLVLIQFWKQCTFPTDLGSRGLLTMSAHRECFLDGIPFFHKGSYFGPGKFASLSFMMAYGNYLHRRMLCSSEWKCWNPCSIILVDLCKQASCVFFVVFLKWTFGISCIRVEETLPSANGSASLLLHTLCTVDSTNIFLIFCLEWGCGGEEKRAGTSLVDQSAHYS